MKRKKVTEPDLYVINRKPTENELKELSEFIANYKKKKAKKVAAKKRPRKKAA